MENQIGQHKGTDRKVVRNMVTNYGLATTLNLFAAALEGCVAGTKGRSTLEERPYHFAHKGIQSAFRTIPRSERNVLVTSQEDLALAQMLLGAYGPQGIISFLSQVTTNETKGFQRCLTRAASEIEDALEHLAVRRALFKPSKKAVELGLVNVPSAEANEPEIAPEPAVEASNDVAEAVTEVLQMLPSV